MKRGATTTAGGNRSVRRGKAAPATAARYGPRVPNVRLVPRPRLVEALDRLAAGALVVNVEAPAGFGKTAALAAWRDYAGARGRRIVWLTLATDDTPPDCANHLLQSARDAGLRAPLRPAGASASVARLVGDLCHALRDDGTPTTIVLDEVEAASRDVCEDVVQRVLRAATPGLGVLLCGRGRPYLRIAALRAAGVVRDLDATALALRPEEVAQLFDLRLSRRALHDVMRFSGGWPALVQLLRADSNALEPTQPPPEAVAFVDEEVLAELPASTLRTLVELSALDRIDAAGTHEISGDSRHLQRLLEEPRLRLLARRRTDEPDAIELHPALRAAALRRLEIGDATRRRAVLAAAARHAARHGHLPHAVELARSSGEIELVGRIVLEAGGVHVWIRHGAAVTNLVDALLPPETLARFPRLRLLRALAQIKAGDLRSARRSFEEARAAHAERDGAEASHSQPWRGDALVVEVTLLMSECQPVDDAYVESIEDALSSVREDDHLLRAMVRNLYCVACAQRGRFADAAAAAHAAIAEYRLAGSVHGQLFEHLHLAVIACAEGEPAGAKTELARAREIVRRHFRGDRAKQVLLGGFGAELAYEQGAVALAMRLLRAARAYAADTELWFDAFAAFHCTAAAVALARRGPGDALDAIRHAWHEAVRRNSRGVLPLLAATEASCLAIGGMLAEARARLDALPRPLGDYVRDDDGIFWREREAVLVAALRVAARTGELAIRPDEVERCLQRLWTGRQTRAAIRVAAALAAACWALERPAQALAHLDVALRASHRTGYVAAFREDRAPLQPVLARWCAGAADTAEDELRAHASALLDGSAGERSGGHASPRLTAREAEILVEVGRGRSDKEIARALRVSENTVKFHLKNLYAKLQVGRRIDAVAEARRRGLVG